MVDPYSTEPHEGGTKPPKNISQDVEGGTRVVGPSDYTGKGMQVPQGVQRTILDHDPKTAVGVRPTNITFDPRRPGAVPTSLPYDPMTAIGVQQRHPVDVNAIGTQATLQPWYTVKAKIDREGVGEKNAVYLKTAVFLHARRGSFLPAPLAQKLRTLSHFGDAQAAEALQYAQAVEAQVRAQMRQRGQA
jgi:hypothetical protein